MKHRKRKKVKTASSNRLNLIMAVIFLLAGAIVFRLFSLQVLKYDLYIALASDQHQVYNKLKPSRGEIYIQDGPELSGNKLYPLATNKDFALLYAVPEDISDSEGASEQLYEIFDRLEIEKDVDLMLDSDEFFSATSTKNLLLTKEEWEEREEFKKIKRELEIEIRKKELIEAYRIKLSKKNDPYEPIKNKIEKELAESTIAEFDPSAMNYIMESHRYYPEGNIGAHFLGFVGYSGDERVGRYGLEGFFNEELSGSGGSIKTERSAGGGLIIINEREFNKPKNGSSLVLTINRSIQYEACNSLYEAAVRHGADGGSVIVMEPKTGAILAMCSVPDFDPNNYSEVDDIAVYNNPAIFDEYEPGSIFKVFTMAAGIDRGDISPDTKYTDYGTIKVEGWPKPIKNSDFDTYGPHGLVDMVTVLELSLNTGSIHIMQKIGAYIFADYVKRFGFGEKTGIELEAEGGGNINSLLRETIRPVEAATATFGQGITATPLQIISGYASIINGGILVKPYLVSEIINADGTSIKTQPQELGRVIAERTAILVSGMMVKVVEGGHAKLAAVKGYFVGGKTGTAQVASQDNTGYHEDNTIHSFVGFAPFEDPKFVMLVKLNNPKDVIYSASSAAPLFAKIADFILNYYQVPKER